MKQFDDFFLPLLQFTAKFVILFPFPLFIAYNANLENSLKKTCQAETVIIAQGIFVVLNCLTASSSSSCIMQEFTKLSPNSLMPEVFENRGDNCT